MNLKHTAILSVLLASKNPMTRQEIYDALEPSERGLLSNGINGLSKELDALKSKRLFIENGLSEIVNGKTLLTWKLTDTGLRAINARNALKTAATRTVDATPDYSGPVLDTAAKQLNEAETLTPIKVELIDGVLKEIKPQSDEETFKQCITTINELYAKNNHKPTVHPDDLADMQLALDHATQAIVAISTYINIQMMHNITLGLNKLKTVLKQLEPHP